MKKSTFLEGPILPSLMKFAVPIIMAMFLQALYGACDLWAVGTFSSAADMSAVATASQAIIILNGFFAGISVGATVLLGVRIGEKKYKEAAEVFGATFWIIIMLSAVMTVLLVTNAGKIAVLVNAPAEALQQTENYLRICGMGIVFILGYNGISGLFRGIGNSVLPLIFVAVACVTNIVMDIVLIKYFHMGATGAAIATVLAQAVSVLLSIFFIKRYDFKFEINKAAFKFKRRVIESILRIGMPIALLQFCNEIYYLILIVFINTLGVAASAGAGIAEKLIIFLVLVPTSFMSALASFVSHNIGAKQHKRAKESLWKTLAMSMCIGFVLACILFFFGRTLSMLFNSDPEVLDNSAIFLKAISLECFLLSGSYCFTGYFNGIGKTKFVMFQGFFVIFCVKIPYACFTMKFLDHKLVNLGISAVLGAAASLAICIGYYYITARQEKKKEVEEMQYKEVIA